MKKHVFLLGILFVLVCFSSLIEVMAYSPHYLPGGKNYLSSENFAINEEGDEYNTIDTFVVKPYTEYTLTTPRIYSDGRWEYIQIEFYNNETPIDSYTNYNSDLTYYEDGSYQGYYFSFTTTSETNYLSIAFHNESNYFQINGLTDIQLEEGNQFTGYEPYTEGALIDTSAPYFQNANKVISYYDSPITLNEIQSALVAYDAIDGDVTSNISVITENYTENMGVLGSYSIIFEVTDSSNNSSQINVVVDVVDVLKPVFSNLDTIPAVYPNSYTVQDILGMLSASDNYDGDISSSIIMIGDDYSENTNIVGVYQMIFSVTDSSGNSETYYQDIEVVDDQAPIISGTTSIIIGYDSIITEDDVKANLSFTDNYDDIGNMELILESDSYSENHNTLGDYSMVFSVTDSSGNKTNKIININVVDELGPVVYFDSSIIQTYDDTVMALPDFTELLVNSNEIDKYTDYYVTVKYDSYTKNANIPGVYHISLNLKTELGKELNKDLEIRVLKRPSDYVQIADPKLDNQESFLERYSNYIIKGALSLLLVVSNVVWVVILKKKS
ncbi:hypothetical protein RJI07_06275 [Mycoplasmatota bacterium WC30]